MRGKKEEKEGEDVNEEDQDMDEVLAACLADVELGSLRCDRAAEYIR